MEIQINNYNDLLEFIKRDDINPKQATEIVCKALNVIAIFEMTKDEVITATEYHINKFCQTAGERPIFLTQKEDEFNIKDIFN
jgi:ethanolamine utilization protein EutP (predicted NTPase)